ncbi:MAG: hypothetical protein ACI9PP_002443 [Halobacteriales archaeon]|jgi:hypothetical protein
MPDRTDERTRERERSEGDLVEDHDDFTDFQDLDKGHTGQKASEELHSVDESTKPGDESGIRSRLSRLFSPQGFLLRAGAMVAGVVGAGFVPLLPATLGAFLGILMAGFGIGLFESEQSYLETGSAGLLLGAVAALLNNLTLTFFGGGAALVLIGALGGLIGALLGLYFGRDLRAGLSKEI